MSMIVKLLMVVAALVATMTHPSPHRATVQHMSHAHPARAIWAPLPEYLRQALDLPAGCRIHYADTTVIRCPDGTVIES